MSALVTPIAMFPPTSQSMIDEIRVSEAALVGHEPVEVPTQHVLHAGLYSRTIVMPAGMVLTGVVIKRATLVIVVGSAMVLAGDESIELEGYNVVPASAGRKQVFVSRSPVIITMLFPTQAKTVEDAEVEMSDEHDLLLSHRQNSNTVVITGE